MRQVGDIRAWLEANSFARFADTFEENEIDGEALLELTEEHLKDLGIALGPRLKLLKAIQSLRREADEKLPAPEPTAKPRSLGPRAREAERRQLTVLFCDLVGSTELSGRLDPEDLRTVMSAYQAVCAEVVGGFAGHVAKYLGDGVLAYFGWPQAHEDDAERAVRAGLQLAETIPQLEPHAEVQLQARIGIATGPAVVGDLIGEGAAREEAVVGETPNLAARLQALAAPGAVVISQATRRLVGGLFELADLGPKRLKGFAAPLQVWRVAGEGLAEDRFEARHGAGLTPLVGRDEEIALLLRRWCQSKDGEGQVVLLSGEPGIGKSRIVREVRARLQGEPHVRLLYQCSPHHTTSPLHPVIERLERAARFARDDPPEARLDKLETLLARGTDRLEAAVPLIAALLGLPTADRYAPLDLTPERQKQLTLAALVDQIEGLTAAQPALLAYEDVHWIDPTTQELLGLTIERIQRLPVLVLITFRPDFIPPWLGQPHVSVLALNRLGRREGAAMVDRVIGAKALPDAVSAQIVAKTDGVPLFVEELTKTVLESGLLEDRGDRYELTGPLPPLAIPATLHDSLLARLDRLAPVKEVAQIGAAIGREFSHALLAAVSDRPKPELQAALDQLVAAELVFRRGAPPEASYSFKHALVGDVAYDSLLKSKRQQLHARIAQILEERFPDTAPEILAHHFDEAGLGERAVVLWQRAGTRALERSAINEAIAHHEHALVSLADVPQGRRRDDMELDIQIALASAYISARGYGAEETECAYLRARDLLHGTGGDPRRFAVLNGLFVINYNWAQVGSALEIAQDFLREATTQKETAPLCVAHRSVAVAQNTMGDFASALRHAHEAEELYDPNGHTRSALQYGHDIGVAALMHVALAKWHLGFPDQAFAAAARASELASELRHANTRGYACLWSGYLHLRARDAIALLAKAEELMRIADEQYMALWLAIGRCFLGAAKIMGGDCAIGIDLLETGTTALEKVRVREFEPTFMGLQAHACARLGRLEEARKLLDEALARARNTKVRWYQAELYRVSGDLWLRTRDQSAAEGSFRKAVEVAQKQAARSWELRAATSLARLWVHQGKRAQAHDLLSPVYDWFTEGFDTADLKDAKALLDELA